MGSAKKSRISASKISSAANPASSSAARSANTSTILRCSFAPPSFQLSLFASVIQSYDSQLLRIHDTLTGHLRCEHRITPKSTVTCLDWGFCGTNRRQHDSQGSQAKRKRSKTLIGLNYSGNAKDVVVAYGTSGSEIQMYSPTDARVTGVLSNGHTQGVRDFKFKYGVLNPEGWSIGGDGKLVQWDLQKTKSIRTIAIPDPLATVLCPFGHSIICASNKVVLIDPETTSQNQSFGASSGRIHSVLTSTVSSSHPDLFLTAAESDRFINVFDAEKKDSIGSLVAESDVLSLTLSPSDDNLIFTKDIASNQTSELQILAAINRDGALEFFESPFVFSASLPQGQSESLKARFKRRTRKSTAQVRIIASDGSNNVLPIIAASFQGNDCILAWAGGGVKMLFHRIPWRNEGTGEALLSGEVEVIKPNPIAISDISTSTGAIDGKRGRVDESRTIVADADDLDTTGVGAQEPTVINISSDEDESNDEDAEFLAEPESRQPSIRSSSLDPRHRKAEGSVSDGDVEMNDAEANGLDEAPEPEESNEQSFGELVKAYAPEPVDIQASISTSHQQISASRREEKPQLTSGMSLSTVLTQSLRTNDISLLETCLHMKDLTVVRATIERLDSSLASSLLRKLAERLHSRPGRAGGLMVWIQWTIVAHGGYLASQRDIMKDLESLHRVVGHRASSLPFLLSLKGKLDMLEAQMNLRKSMQTRAIKANALDDDNEEGVIYIEGEAESNSGSESGNEEALDVVSEREYDAPDDRDFNEHTGAEAPLRNKKLKSQAPRTANGIVNDSGDDESPSGEEESSGEEASSTDDESTNEETEEMDLDSVESDVSSGPEEAPAMKRAATSKLVNGLSSGKGQM